MIVGNKIPPFNPEGIEVKILCLIDFVPSFAMDTVFLPNTIPLNIKQYYEEKRKDQ